MADNNDPDRERLAQASRYIRQAVEEILQQSGVPPSTTSMAASARMPPPATPVQPVQSAVQRSTSNGDNRPFQVGSNSGPPESGRRSASQESQQDIFKFPMVLEEETQQKLEISSEKTTRKGKFPFYASEILGNCAFPLSFHRENSNEILIFFAVN